MFKTSISIIILLTIVMGTDLSAQQRSNRRVMGRPKAGSPGGFGGVGGGATGGGTTTSPSTAIPAKFFDSETITLTTESTPLSAIMTAEAIVAINHAANKLTLSFEDKCNNFITVQSAPNMYGTKTDMANASSYTLPTGKSYFIKGSEGLKTEDECKAGFVAKILQTSGITPTEKGKTTLTYTYTTPKDGNIVGQDEGGYFKTVSIGEANNIKTYVPFTMDRRIDLINDIMTYKGAEAFKLGNLAIGFTCTDLKVEKKKDKGEWADVLTSLNRTFKYETDHDYAITFASKDMGRCGTSTSDANVGGFTAEIIYNGATLNESQGGNVKFSPIVPITIDSEQADLMTAYNTQLAKVKDLCSTDILCGNKEKCKTGNESRSMGTILDDIGTYLASIGGVGTAGTLAGGVDAGLHIAQEVDELDEEYQKKPVKVAQITLGSVSAATNLTNATLSGLITNKFVGANYILTNCRRAAVNLDKLGFQLNAVAGAKENTSGEPKEICYTPYMADKIAACSSLEKDDWITTWKNNNITKTVLSSVGAAGNITSVGIVAGGANDKSNIWGTIATAGSVAGAASNAHAGISSFVEMSKFEKEFRQPFLTCTREIREIPNMELDGHGKCFDTIAAAAAKAAADAAAKTAADAAAKTAADADAKAADAEAP